MEIELNMEIGQLSNLKKVNTNKQVLPIVMPPITVFPNLANVLAIGLNYKCGYNWLYNNCIQMFGYLDNDYFGNEELYTLPINFGWFLYTEISFFKPLQVLIREYISHIYKKISDFIIDSINLGYYVRFDYDRYYLPCCKEDYKRNHDSHELLVYGYDIENKKYMVADFFSNGIYSFETVFFDELESAYCSAEQLPESSGRFVFMIKCYESNYNFDKDRVKNLIKDYINSENSVLAYSNEVCYKYPNPILGISNYDLLKDFLGLVMDKKAVIDRRSFNTLYNHKKAMRIRLEYMKNNNLLSDAKPLIEECKLLENELLKCRNTTFKYWITQNNEIIESLIKKIDALKKRDRILMLRIFECIK